MHPDRAARLLSIFGMYLLLAVLGLRVVSLVLITWQVRMNGVERPGQTVIPAVGNYRPSKDGKSVVFEHQINVKGKVGWFSMPLEGGPVTPTTAPVADSGLFQVRDNQLYLKSGNSYTPIHGSPRDTRIASYAFSPDGSALAFVAYRPGISWGLYVLDATDHLEWLGDQDRIDGLAWSPDSHSLAFTAPVNGVSQIFVTRCDGQDQRQLTSDSSYKSGPVWAPDGQSIAYVASNMLKPLSSAPTPTPVPPHGNYPPQEAAPAVFRSSISLIDASGGEPRQFLSDDQDKLNLAWGKIGSNSVVLYALEENSQASYLYALDPRTGQSRRVYPPLEITAFDCPAHLPSEKPETVQISLANSGLHAEDVLLILRAQAQPFASFGAMNTNIVRAATVQVPPGAAQTMEWPVSAVSGLVTHLSAVINPGNDFPIDEKHCLAKNTYYGLPNLSFLPLALPLTAAGLILYIPWLRKQHKPGLWALYLAPAVFALIVLIIEMKIVGM